MKTDDEFQPRLGRIGDARLPRTFLGRVLLVAAKAGGARRTRSLGVGRDPGRGLAPVLTSASRRVVIKARVVRHRGRRYRMAPLSMHLSYLKREGVDRAGGNGRMFDARRDEADEAGFASRCQDDRHHFRFIVSPEDAPELADLKALTRDLMSQADADLKTGLDWIAVEHWNTAHPHVHVLVRGVTDEGADLVMSRDYISRGLRARAEALVSLELGPRSAAEIAASLERDLEAQRWTPLDAVLSQMADGANRRVEILGQTQLGPKSLTLLTRRLKILERLGLAEPESAGVWRLSSQHQPVLRALGERGEIVERLHRAFGGARAVAEFNPDGLGEGAILGRLVERGLHDELTGEAFVILDGVDGRAHYLRLADLAETGDTPVGGIVEAGRNPDRGPLRLVHRSDLPVEAQVAAEGATWLDRKLLAKEPLNLPGAGFGGEVARALQARAEHLADQGLGRRTAHGFSFAGGLIRRLRTRELAKAAASLERELGLTYCTISDGEQISGRYLRRLDLASGRFALIEDGLGFRLAPWSRALDAQLGREVRGLAGPERVSWELGRSRGLEL